VTGNAVSSNALTVRQFGTGNVFSAQTTTGSFRGCERECRGGDDEPGVHANERRNHMRPIQLHSSSRVLRTGLGEFHIRERHQLLLRKLEGLYADFHTWERWQRWCTRYDSSGG
jgi:hypothetical protein